MGVQGSGLWALWLWILGFRVLGFRIGSHGRFQGFVGLDVELRACGFRSFGFVLLLFWGQASIWGLRNGLSGLGFWVSSSIFYF